jgi:hypothetical protein
MQIYGPGQIHGPQPIKAPHRLQAAQPEARVDLADQVDISPQADLVSRVHDAPDIRSGLVNEIRSQIEAGVYETDERLDVAVGRLLDEIG